MIPLLLLLALGGLMHAARSFTEGAGAAGVELAFGFLLLAAYFNSKVLHRLGLPHLTAYLLAGIIAGPHVLALVDHDMTVNLQIVSDVAVCMIALTAGASLDFVQIRPMLGTLVALVFMSVILAAAAIGGAVFLARPFLPWLADMPFLDAVAVSMMLGVTLAAKSPAVVMALVSETRADGPITRLVIATVVVADLAVIVCYAIVSSLTSAELGGGAGVGSVAASVSWSVLGSMIFGALIGAVIGAFLRHVKKGAPLFVVMVCVVVAEIGARIHLDPMIVMLAGGVWLGNLARAESAQLLRGFESAQLPVFLVFFALAGSHIDLGTLYASLAPIVILVVTRAASFFVGFRIATKTTGLAPTVRRLAWLGLIPQAGLALALALIIQQSFAFGPQAAALLLGVVATNELLGPVLLRAVIVRTGEAGKRSSSDFASGH
ncbi:MAG TPA: cation:proton antiporter [Kofleriaceae bacterium]|jgi:Kef-type K+ transport system membrane component KefB|nr:cation:proton antiporter [Kofleriaceae bacterium]